MNCSLVYLKPTQRAFFGLRIWTATDTQLNSKYVRDERLSTMKEKTRTSKLVLLLPFGIFSFRTLFLFISFLLLLFLWILLANLLGIILCILVWHAIHINRIIRARLSTEHGSKVCKMP